MKKATLALVLILSFFGLARAQETGVVPITVTNTPANITVDSTCSRIQCRTVTIGENSATPTAVFSIVPTGTSTTIHFAAGQKFAFQASINAPFVSGQTIGTIVATTSGPFNFTAIEAPASGTGVISINALTGAVTLTAGSNITLTQTGNSISIAASGGGGTPGGSPTEIQFNNTTFGGIPGSSVDPTNGFMTLAPPSGTGVALGLTGDAHGSDVLDTHSTSGGADTFSTSETVAGSVGVLGLNSEAAITDNSATASEVLGLNAYGSALGSNGSGDLIYGAEVGAGWLGSAGTPTEVTGLYVSGSASTSTPAVTETGIHIADQNGSSNPGSTVNAALLIENQTAGSNVYAIQTGLGPVSFGDALTVAANTTSTSAFGANIGGFFTDSAGLGLVAEGANIYSVLEGTNGAGDNSFALEIAANNVLSAGASPAEVSGLKVDADQSTVIASVLQTGIHIADQASFVQASGTNAALLIDDQTPGANTYAIKTGLGAVSLGDQVTVAKGIATGTASNTDLAGAMTASTGTASYNFTQTYTSAPVCVVQDDTTLASLLTKTVTTSTLTATTTGASDQVSYVCHGRN